MEHVLLLLHLMRDLSVHFRTVIGLVLVLAVHLLSSLLEHRSFLIFTHVSFGDCIPKSLSGSVSALDSIGPLRPVG